MQRLDDASLLKLVRHPGGRLTIFVLSPTVARRCVYDAQGAVQMGIGDTVEYPPW